MKLHLGSTLLVSLVLLTACNKDDTNKSVKQANTTSGFMANATDEARNKIRTENMSLGSVSGKAKAEISPQGDLLIDGKPVSVTPEQRQLLIKHRELLANIAISGMEIGMQGVDLAKKAVGESIKGIEDSANLLCEQLPLLMASQQTLSASLPEFKPYATMTAEDIKDCRGKVVDRK